MERRITGMKHVKRGTVLCTLLLFVVCLMGASFTSEAKWVKTKKGYRYTTNAAGTKYYKNKWVKIDGRYYYFDKKGYRKTGWLTYGEQRYYLNKSGTRVTGFKTIDGKKYYFNKKGVLLKGWIKYNSHYYYADDKGVIQTGLKIVGNYIYYFDNAGRRISNTNVVFGNMAYYFAENGTLQYTGTEEEKAVKYINVTRMLNGRAPLTYYTYGNLSYAAAARAQELSQRASHTRPDGRGYQTVLESDYPVAVYWSGECILWGQPKAGVAVAASWFSDQNQSVLLQNYANGISVAKYTDALGCEYWVALTVQTK